MRDMLNDIIDHTHALGFLDTLKVNGTDTETEILSLNEDRSVMMFAKTLNSVEEFQGNFGMPDLTQLNILLKIPEYSENAKLTLNTQERNGKTVPSGIHFENASGDFQNDYRFMNSEVVSEKMKIPSFKGATWNVELEPTLSSISRFGFQASANPGVSVFAVKTDENQLIFHFGDHSSHAGYFVFANDVAGSLNKMWAYPVTYVSKILNLNGDKKLQISDAGVMQITVNSGMAEYKYIIPAKVA